MRGRRRPAAAVGRLDLQRDAGVGQADGQPDVADVLLEPGRPDQIGDRPDGLAAVERRALLGELEGQRITRDLDPVNSYFTSTVGDLISDCILGRISPDINNSNINLRKSTLI